MIAPTTVPKFCPRCGQPTRGGRFCGTCGNALLVAEAPARWTVAVPSAITSVLSPKTGATGWLVLVVLVAVLLSTVAALSFALASITPSGVSCIASCGRPALAAPLDPPYRYTSAAFGYSVSLEYAVNASDRPVMKLVLKDERSIGWLVTSRYHPERGTWPFVFSGQRANGAGADQIATSLVRAQHPDARLVYTIPQAELGYAPGYGAVYDLTLRVGTGDSVHARIIVEVAIKRGLAVVLNSIGPYVKSAPGEGHPNPAETTMPLYFADAANSVTWPGDTPL